MAVTKVNLDRQAVGKTFSFGTSSASGEGLVTINKGSQATSTIVLDVKATANIEGNLNLVGNLNITGDVNTQSVTNLDVTDKVITVNKSGAASSGGGSGLEVEEGGAITGAIRFDSTLASKFTIGDGTTQIQIVDVSSAQTLANKTLASSCVVPTSTLSGVTDVDNGGTGQSSYVNGELLIGNTTGNTLTKATLTAGTGITITNGNGSITIATSGGAASYFRKTAVSTTPDGTTVAFTIGNALTSDTEIVIQNGIVLEKGGSADYTISGTTITFAVAPALGDKILVFGQY